MPRFILFMRASKQSESGLGGTPEIFSAMAAYNETMVAAGIMHAGEGLHPSSNDSRRIIWHPESEKKTEVVPGPFPVKELVCGWWIIKVGSVEEAVEWAEKCPCMEEGSTIEVRRIADAEDFGSEFDEGMREKEEEMRKKTEELAKGIK
ncbi:hypothetical protein ACEPPN_001849 [Leptodophora sp. 'Broadleaf-Isolate-01']